MAQCNTNVLKCSKTLYLPLRLPLPLLMDTWISEDIPVGIGTSVCNYLADLKCNLEAATDIALEYAGKHQLVYAYYKN